MKQKRFAGMANRALRIVAACAVLMMTAGVCSCGGKASAQGSAGSTAEEKEAEKQAKSELKELESQIKKALGVSPEELMATYNGLNKRVDEEEIARVLARYEVATTAEKVEMLKSSAYNVGEWSASTLAKVKSYVADAKKTLSAVSEKKEKFVKEYKRIAEVKAMSVEELKKQPPAPESDFEVAPLDDSYTAIWITKYKGKDPLVVIPATMQGLPVKMIGPEAFERNNNLVAVVTPEGMVTINDNAFRKCPNLSVAVISEGVWNINGAAFYECKNLSTVVLPSTLKTIDSVAFSGCSNLTSIELPAGLVYIGEEAFYNSGLTSVKLPEGLVYIDERAFSGSGLTSVSLPKSLRLLGQAAFGDEGSSLYSCDSLAEIQIPADHAISMWSCGSRWYEGEYSFVNFFFGTKIKESIALQKLLNETETRKISRKEFNGILADIAKQIGAREIDGDNGSIHW